MRAPSPLLGLLWLLRLWPLLGLLVAHAPARAQAPQAPLRPAHEPGSQITSPSASPPVGACIGGSCKAAEPTVLDAARLRPYALPVGPTKRTVPRRQRFAYTGAVLGTVSAGLVLGGAIAIGVAADLHSERITRGVWLGYVATTTPLVALSAWLARREGGSDGFLALRRFGWLAYALSVSDGALLWSSAFGDNENPRFLTIAAGVFGTLALLPHALDALSAAHALRSRRFRALAVKVSGTGVLVRF